MINIIIENKKQINIEFTPEYKKSIQCIVAYETCLVVDILTLPMPKLFFSLNPCPYYLLDAPMVISFHQSQLSFFFFNYKIMKKVVCS